ncbi:MAG TPA: cupin domain-containing protein [Rhizomicrobium sp.]|nr:cupin domain-containing protein [Rhizomicrobium sp.]
MKTVLLAAALLSLLPLPLCAQPAPQPTKLYASSAEVQALVAKAKAEHKTGNTVELVVNDEGYPFQLEYRTDTTPPSIHPTHAELIEIIEGSCTLITGGKMIGLKPAATPGAMTQGGTSIEGGTPRKVSKGDYILVPANTPHQYTEVNGLIMMTLHMPVEKK